MAHVFDSQLDAFEIYHRLLEDETLSRRPRINPALPALGHAVSGSIGSAISNVVVYPLALVITRLQVQKQFENVGGKEDVEEEGYQGLHDAVVKIYEREGGIAAFYDGVVQDTAKSMADSFLFFLAYNVLRKVRIKARGSPKRLPIGDELGVGMAAGAFARLFTTPVQNIVTRKQTAAMKQSRGSVKLSARDIARQIHDEKGWRGFWSGYSATLVLTLNPALTFLFHQALTTALVPRKRRAKPGARVTFVLAAISKAMASSITYPFSLAKARSQVSTGSSRSTKAEEEELMTESELDVRTQRLAEARRRWRQTVFGKVLHIAQTEGILSLYYGLGGEVLKGFFSHGLTMLMKERIHTVIIQLYYLLLKAARRYPSPEQLAQSAVEQAKEVTQDVSEKTAGLAEELRDVAQETIEESVGLIERGREYVWDSFEGTEEDLAELYTKSKEETKDLLWGILDEDGEE